MSRSGSQRRNHAPPAAKRSEKIQARAHAQPKICGPGGHIVDPPGMRMNGDTTVADAKPDPKVSPRLQRVCTGTSRSTTLSRVLLEESRNCHEDDVEIHVCGGAARRR